MLHNELIQVLTAAEQMVSYYAATLTDQFMLGIWGDPDSRTLYENDVQSWKLLELRIFNKDKEILARRADISEPFQIRSLNDRQSSETINSNNGVPADELDYFDEIQLLDIDRKQSNRSDHVKTTGGGIYRLPKAVYKMNNPGLIVRHYFGRYPQTGIAFIRDWRCVGFKDLTANNHKQKGGNGDEQT